MLQKPNVADELIVSALNEHYELNVHQIEFLPWGADVNTAAYRVIAKNGTEYFAKLRFGTFDEIAVEVPKFLNDQGIVQVMAPIATRTQHLEAILGAANLILYPFVDGYNATQVELTDEQWIEFGATLKRVHSTALPRELSNRLPEETYLHKWQEKVKEFLFNVDRVEENDSATRKLTAILRSKQDEIETVVHRAEELGKILQRRNLKFALCHSDIHEANLLIGKNGDLHIVDWDNPIFAPKERDLMFIGGGCASVPPNAQHEAMFYRGYGEREIDAMALTYYRYERIVEDIAAFCEQILSTQEDNPDRERAIQHLMNQFQPNGVIEIAYRTDELPKMTN